MATQELDFRFKVSGQRGVIRALDDIANRLNGFGARFGAVGAGFFGLTAGAQGAGSAIDRLLGAASALGQRLSAGFSLGISAATNLLSTVAKLSTALAAAAAFTGLKLGQGLIDADVNLASLTVALEQVAGEGAGAQEELDRLRKVASDLGVKLGEVAVPFAQFANGVKSAGGELQTSRDTFLGITQAGLALGASSDAVGRSLNQLTQIASKNKLSMEDIGAISESLPGFLGLAAQAVGKTTEEFTAMVATGEAKALPFLDKLGPFLQDKYGAAAVKASKDAQSAQARLSNAFGRMKEIVAGAGFTDAAQKIFEDLTRVIEGFNTSGASERFGQKLGQRLESTYAALKRFGRNFYLQVAYIRGGSAGLLNAFRLIQGSNPSIPIYEMVAIQQRLAPLVAKLNAIKLGIRNLQAIGAEAFYGLSRAVGDFFAGITGGDSVFNGLAGAASSLSTVLFALLYRFSEFADTGVFVTYGRKVRAVFDRVIGAFKATAGFVRKYQEQIKFALLVIAVIVAGRLVRSIASAALSFQGLGTIAFGVLGAMAIQSGKTQERLKALGTGVLAVYNAVKNYKYGDNPLLNVFVAARFALGSFMNLLSNAFGSVVPKQIGVSQGFFERFFSAVAYGLDQMGRAFNTIGGRSFRGLGQDFVYEGLDPRVAALIDRFYQLKAAVGQVIGFGVELGTSFGQGLEALYQKMEPTRTAILTLFQNIVADIQNQIAQVDFKSIGDDLKLLVSGGSIELVKNDQLTIVFQVRDAVGKLLDKLNEIAPKILPIIEQLGTKLLDAFVRTFEFVNGTLMPALDSMAQTLGFDSFAEFALKLAVVAKLFGVISTVITVITTGFTIFMALVDGAVVVFGVLEGIFGVLAALASAIGLPFIPFLLLIAAIAAAAYVLYTYWDQIKAAALEFGAYLSDKIVSGINWLVDKAKQLPEILLSLLKINPFDALLTALDYVFPGIKDKIYGAITAGFNTAIDFAKQLLQGAAALFKDYILKPLQEGWNYVKSKLGFGGDSAPAAANDNAPQPRGYKGGGQVGGTKGTGTSDSILARLSRGEFVMPWAAVKRYGLNVLEAMRSGSLNLPKFASGGAVAMPRMAFAAPAAPLRLAANSNERNGGDTTYLTVPLPGGGEWDVGPVQRRAGSIMDNLRSASSSAAYTSRGKR